MSDPAPAAPIAYLEAHPERARRYLTELLGFDTQNPPGGTEAAVAWLSECFADRNLTTERVAVDPAKPNLVVRLPGSSETVLTFVGHLDTVPFDVTAWSVDPLGEVDGDRIHGRGATDMKGAIAAMLAAVEAYVETGTTPPVTLELALVSDEETGGDAGLPELLDRDTLTGDACVIGEPTCERGRHSVAVADRGSIWLTMEATGVAAHGSRPMLGVNAVDRLYEAITELRERVGSTPLDVPDRLEPVIEESVEYYAPILGEAPARDLFRCPTINLGTIEGGEAINSVPKTAVAEVDIRLTAGVDTSKVLSDIRACAADCEGVKITDVSWSVGSAESPDSPLVETVSRVATQVTGERVYRRSATGGGDAKSLRHSGIPTVEFAFATDTSHAVDEYTTAEILRRNARTYAGLPGAIAREREGVTDTDGRNSV